jgi:hypothetical protein
MTGKPKAIIISGADAGYFSLAQDLFNSIALHKFAVNFDLGMLDVGLSSDQLPWFAERNITVAKAGQDIDFPARDVWEASFPYRAMTARPNLRRYFPGYDIYLWLDADIWVQTPDAINALIPAAAKSDALHIAMEFDRSYPLFFKSATMWNVYHGWYHACFNDDNVTAHMTLKPMLNSGMFAMAGHSPVWDEWLRIYTDALQKIKVLDSQTIMTEQLSLNRAVYMSGLPYVVMPATFNWLTFFGTPMLDQATGLYVEPSPPYAPISQFHLTQKPKHKIETITCRDGSTVEHALTFSARKG